TDSESFSFVAAPADAHDRGMIRSRLFLVVVAASVIISAAMGVRPNLGLFLSPLAVERGIPVSTIALAIALHNLVWGLVQPITGAAADRHGAARIVALGVLSYAGGLALAATTSSGVVLVLGMGVLIGLGMSATTF